MVYIVYVANKPKKFVENLFPDYKKTIKERLEELQFNPYPRGYISLEGQPDCYRIKIGPFRIQYAVSEQTQSITVFKISRRDDSTYKD